jgi:hypothetical protein
MIRVMLELLIDLARQRCDFLEAHAHLLHRAAALAFAQAHAGDLLDA